MTEESRLVGDTPRQILPFAQVDRYPFWVDRVFEYLGVNSLVWGWRPIDRFTRLLTLDTWNITVVVAG